MSCRGLANALELAVFEHTQEFRLQIEGQFTDFIEKQRAVGRILEIACARAVGTGKRPFAVTEQGRLDQVWRNRGAVERQVGLCGALGKSVQCRGGQFLAAARFAFDQHRKWRTRELPELGAQFLQRCAFTDQAVIHLRRCVSK